MTTTSEEYAAKILEEIIRRKIRNGDPLVIDEVEEEFNSYLEANDINNPLFSSEKYKVERNSESSASLANNTHNSIKQDMDIAFRALFKTTREATHQFNRWDTKADKLENRLIDLESRMTRLLLGIQDTAGYFNSVGDKFTDTTKIDLDLSSNIDINLKYNIIKLSKDSGSSSSVSRVFLEDLKSSQVKFNVLTSGSVTHVSNEQNTLPVYAFKDSSRYWKTNVFAQSRVSPMLGELVLSLVNPIKISKLNLALLSSQSNSSTRITPMYSTDGINFSRLPIANTVVDVIDKAEFVFPEVEVLKLKILFEKSGHDFIDSSGFYVYEFGLKEVFVYTESYNNDPNFVGTLVSKPLNIRKADGTNLLFNKVTLEVCESVPEDTFINYFIAVAKEDNGLPSWLTSSGFTTDYIVDGIDTRTWSPITPLNRSESLYSKVLDLSVSSRLEKDGIRISYDKDGGLFVSPKQTFSLMQSDNGSIKYESCTNNPGVENRRYFLVNPSHRLLDLQIDLDLDIDLESINLWRNVGEKGVDPSDITKRVRGVQIGWEYKEPYYTTTIYIKSSDGMSIDVGSHPITIDNSSYTGLVGPSVLSKGVHTIKIHKDYWRSVPPNLTTLADLKAADPLYPYNQKLLIEGYSYPEEWDEEKIYRGADRFAGYLLTKVSNFDMLNNISATDYSKFSIDQDSPATSTIDSTSTEAPLSRVFIVNIDTSKADFINENFVLEFNLTSELYSYIALRAEMSTDNNQISPAFDEYRVKLGA